MRAVGSSSAAVLEVVSWPVARSTGPRLRVLEGQRRHFSRRIDGYLQYYGKLKNQEGMLRDGVRLEGYRAALEAAAPRLKGAVVMDIGTGSGILAFLAARYGARKVYAVEASPQMSRLASRLARSNNLVGVVEVVPKHLEDISDDDVEPGSVDVIVSELFSHFMVGELGPQAVTYAKQRFLRPGGLVLPAKAIMKLSPFEDKELAGELRARHRFWLQSDFHGFDLSPAWPIAEEQMLRETILDVVEPSTLLLQHLTNLKPILSIFPQQPQLSLLGPDDTQQTPVPSTPILDSILQFAVPKKRMSLSKKRMKTTVRDRIPLKSNIIRDGRTRQMTLMHKLPFRWKEYIPDLMIGYEKREVVTATGTENTVKK